MDWFDAVVLKIHKVCSEKTDSEVDVNISVNFSHIRKNLVSQEFQIFIAFQRGALQHCTFTM